MVRKRELVKQRGAFDSMGLAEGIEVRAQGLGIAGNIDNVVKLGNQLQRFIIDAGSGRIDKNRRKIIIFQRDTLFLQAAEFAALRVGFGNSSAERRAILILSLWLASIFHCAA